jgi:hypothetical protein
MAKSSKPAGAKPIVDVAHPGKSAPATNSKSVIISNRPLLKDPMMVGDSPPASDDSPAKISPAKTSGQPGEPVLSAPLLEPEKPAETDESTVLAETAKPPEAATVAELAEAANAAGKPASPDSEPKPDDPAKPKAESNDKPEPDTAKAEKPAEEKPETDTDTEETPSSKEDNAKHEEAEAAKRAEHQAAIDKLAVGKQYYLPINAVEKRRSKRFVAIGIILSLLLILAWADIALDAGLIHLSGIKPLTHFFST